MTSASDFHSILYICAAEYDFLPASTLYRLSKTLLLPSVYISLGMVAAYVMGLTEAEPLKVQETKKGPTNRSAKRERAAVPLQLRKCDPAVLYNVLQLAAFVVMAAMIMRLKLFMSPHLCIVTSLLASRKVPSLIILRHCILLQLKKFYSVFLAQYAMFIKSTTKHYALIVLLISAMCVTGLRNLQDQSKVLGEYNNPELEELINWITKETASDEAFAGPMPLTATILLTTLRPIVNHPHYEDSSLRERTKKV